jgi:hemolysin III
MLIYLGMGWVGAVEFSDLRVAISDTGLYWLIAGGLAYTLGVVFYLLDCARMLTHAHGIWHFFVLVGSVCHFVSTIGYVR